MAIGGLGDIAASSAGEALAFGLGFALGRALEPVGVGISQTAWVDAPLRAPDVGPMADGVATGKVDAETAAAWAKQHGYSAEAFGALVDVASTGPALGYAFQAWRRGEMSDDDFTTALRRTGLETQWDAAIQALKDDRLDLGAIATAIHRGIMRGEGLIITEPPTDAGNVPYPPQSTIDPVDEAAAHGIDAERLRILVGNTGLPPGLIEMLRLLNLGTVTEDDVRRAVAESNMRNEYMDVVLNLRRRLLTPHEYAELNLRGWISPDEMQAGASLSGMEAPDADLLFKMLGRPLAIRQIVTAIARGGAYGGDYDGVPEPYQTALRESSIRPEWGNLAYANRYTYPSAFVLRALAQAGELTEDETLQILLDIGWEPGLAKTVSAQWARGTATGSDKNVVKAQGELWTALHKAYVNDDADDATARATLTAIGVEATAQTEVLGLWVRERDLVRLDLTPTQIKKAFSEAKFTHDVALGRLERLGMSPADAATLLSE